LFLVIAVFPLGFQLPLAIGIGFLDIGRSVGQGKGEWLAKEIQLIWGPGKFATTSGTVVENNNLFFFFFFFFWVAHGIWSSWARDQIQAAAVTYSTATVTRDH